MVKLKGISAGYGEKTVLRNISMDFPPGTVTAILGPNGCGKSTLLKTAAGLLPVTAGEITMDEPHARRIAYLPQSRSVPEMTAGRLVLHGRFPWLTWPRRYRAEDEAEARAAMERLGVAELSDTPLAELSGGTRQKCYLAMALAQGADTLLLDEPTSFLDIGHQLQLMALCRELAAEGKALAVVLHDLPLALDTPEAIFSSGLLDRIFGVRVLQIPTPAGMQYVCVPK